jgi:O-antigen/teichoic acid export membrane protein
VKLSHAFLGTLAAREVTLVATFANQVVLARGLGAAGFGSYLLIVAIAHLLAQAFGFGLNYSNPIMAARHPERGGLMFTMSVLPILLVFPVAVAATLLGPSSTSWLLGSMPANHRMALWLGTGIIAYTSSVGGVLFGLERFRAYNLVSAAPAVGLCVTNSILLLAGSLSVERVIQVWVLWMAITGILMSAVLVSRVRPEFKIDLILFRQLLLMGGRALFCAVLGFATTRTILILLDRSQGTAAVGIYGPMVAFSDLLAHAPAILSSILTNRASAERVSTAQIAKVLRMNSVLSLVGGILLAVLAPVILRRAFGEEFSRAPLALWVLLGGSYCVGFWTLSASYFTGKEGYPLVTIGLVILSTVTTLGLAVVLIPRFGLLGAAISVSTSAVVVGLSSLVVLVRRGSREIGWHDLVPRSGDIAEILNQGASLWKSWVGKVPEKASS